MAEATPTRRGDVAADRRVLLRLTGVVALGYGLGASVQAAYVYSNLIPAWRDVSVWSRVGANVLAVVLLVGALWAMGVHRWVSRVRILGGLLLASVVAAGGRTAAQELLSVYTNPERATIEAEFLAGMVLAFASGCIGVWGLLARRRSRAHLRRAEREALEVEHVLEALEAEEVRVRREVAEGLHGSLQGKLVVVNAHLDEVLGRIEGSADPDDVATLRRVRDELDVVRELDVRQMSRLLYPERLELGLVPAVRALLGRLPTAIATRLTVSPEVRTVDDPVQGTLSTAQRLLAVRVVEEGVTNALKNGPAATIVVVLDVVDRELVVAVENDGPAPDPARGSDPDGGTARLASRLHLVRGTVRLEALRPRGARLEARLPL
ncbi:sensor histidine kinase [Cellulomonas palmilytica]|uniref:sensor histidine kinase n=1 Tax=Cellulomonas palmilytica TaxID=2608402 RepID=UPI001F3A51F0|nr:ATP-binding protein [Cellulomonas palmilytica]UJP40951.1 ATP-binding protein [Cellulomonas palmilytica]